MIEETIVVTVTIKYSSKALRVTEVHPHTIPSLEVFRILVDTPNTCFRPIQVQATVKMTDIELSITRIIHVPLTSVTSGITLFIIIYSPFIPSYFKRILRIIKLYTFPTAAIVIFIIYKVYTVPFATLEDEFLCTVVVGISSVNWR